MNKEILEAAKCCSNRDYICSVECPLFGAEVCNFEFAKAITDYHEKHRWHDLRKNPDDLPTDYTRKFEFVKLWFDGDISVSLGTATYISDNAFGKSRGSSNEVIAWREIDLEQFESEDELK